MPIKEIQNKNYQIYNKALKDNANILKKIKSFVC